ASNGRNGGARTGRPSTPRNEQAGTLAVFPGPIRDLDGGVFQGRLDARILRLGDDRDRRDGGRALVVDDHYIHRDLRAAAAIPAPAPRLLHVEDDHLHRQLGLAFIMRDPVLLENLALLQLDQELGFEAPGVLLAAFLLVFRGADDLDGLIGP